MTTHDAPATQHVVVAVDGTPDARAAVRHAARIALATDAVLHLVAAHRVDDTVEHEWRRANAPADIGHSLSARGEAELLLDEALEELAGLRLAVRTHARRGALANALRSVVRETGAGDVVVPRGRERRSLLGRLAFPSLAQRLDLVSARVVAIGAGDGPAVVAARPALVTLEQALVGDAPLAPAPKRPRRPSVSARGGRPSGVAASAG